MRLNYHHLYHFWAVAKQGNLTRAAQQLHVSQSALSTQIKQLEDQVGQALFVREGRRLALTETGRIARDYATRIFATGDELLATLRSGQGSEQQVLRIGASATLSRNFQENFINPLMGRSDVELILSSGTLGELLTRLSAHTLDLVLSNRRVHDDGGQGWRCRRIARQSVSLVGPPRAADTTFRFPDDLDGMELVLPGADSEIRSAFDLLCEQFGIRYRLIASADDMAMLRLLARDTHAAAVMPSVVVRDELRDGRLQVYCQLPNLYEYFFAISIKRHYQHPLLKTLLARSEADVLSIEDRPAGVAADGSTAHEGVGLEHS